VAGFENFFIKDGMTQKFTAVLFDLDGTLVDSAALVADSVQNTFSDYGLPAPAYEAIIGYMGIPIEVYFKALGGAAYAELDEPTVFNTYRAHFKTMLDAGRLKPFDGVIDLLSGLKARGILTGIVTSKATQPAIYSCEKAGIADYLDTYVGSDLVAGYKPAPDTVFKCLEQLGLPAGLDICVVGDAEGDIGMGRDAGCVTCGVTWGAHDGERLLRQKPDHIATTMAQLSAFIGL